MSIEDDLRRSLQARANDVTPDPATFARVQTRIRRGRTFRLAFAGLATALAVSGIAVAAPRLIDRRIEFEPGPLATAPAPDATVSPAVSEPQAGPAPSNTRLVFTDGQGVYAMALDGEAAETLIPSPCPEGSDCDMNPLESVAAYATGPDADDITVVAASCDGLQYSIGGAAPQRIDSGADVCTSSAVFSPSTGHLAWIGRPTPEGTPTLHTVDWTSDGPGDDQATFGLPWDSVSEVSIQDWVWIDDSTTKGELILRGRRNGIIQMLRMPIEEQADGAIATTWEISPVEAQPELVPLAYAASGTGVTHTLEARQGPDGYDDATIVRRIGSEIDAEFAPPAALFNGSDFTESGLWMSDDGAALSFGNATTGEAWYAVYPYEGEGPGPGPVLLAATIRHGELVVMPPAGPAPATEVPSTTTEVDVYFGMEGADACTANQKVTREVEGLGVARAALTELLKGPTSRESNEGIVSPFSADTAGTLNDVTIADRRARVDFADFSDVVGSDSCRKSAIIDALNRTLSQFPNIDTIQYSFDGDVGDFESWIGFDDGEDATSSPPEAVAETAEQIHAAATDRDWDALERLSSETSCTFSDQKEPCVPHWQELEEQGEDPLGILIEILERKPARNPDAPIWVWPAEYFEKDYLGPRAGISEGGVWMFYVLGGD